MDEFEIIATPTLNGVIDECETINKLLNNNKIKEENKNIAKLLKDVSNILIESNILKDNKKLIDDEAIKRLNDEINAIKKESDKIYKQKKNSEKIQNYDDIKKIK